MDDDPYYRLYSGFMGGPLGRFLIRRFNFFAGAFLPRIFGDRKRLTREIHERYTRPFPKPEDRKGSWVFPAQVVGASAGLAPIEAGLGALSGSGLVERTAGILSGAPAARGGVYRHTPPGASFRPVLYALIRWSRGLFLGIDPSVS